MGRTTKPKLGLTQKQKDFCRLYVELGNGTQAALKAGYKETNARFIATENLTKPAVVEEITRLREKLEKPSIATAQQVMEYFTRVMNGEEKDQFGLDAPLSERTKAAQELAKRTVDWEARKTGQPDSVIQIQLDWGRDQIQEDDNTDSVIYEE